MSLAAWNFDPAVVLALVIAAALYARGWRRLIQRSHARQPEQWRALCFSGGLASIALALLSPIGTYDQQLFSFHMVQHLLLTLIGPPLLLLGAPLVPVLWGLPDQERRGVARLIRKHSVLRRVATFVAQPIPALTIFSVVFAVWHIPVLYDAAQGQTLVHYTEHILFFVSAVAFWWPVVHPSGGPRSLSRVASILYFTPPMLEGTVIGALLTFAARPFYSTYIAAPRVSGLSPLDDQQLAGLIMWVPGGLVYALAVLCLVAAALREEELATAAQDDALALAGNQAILLESTQAARHALAAGADATRQRSV